MPERKKQGMVRHQLSPVYLAQSEGLWVQDMSDLYGPGPQSPTLFSLPGGALSLTGSR